MIGKAVDIGEKNGSDSNIKRVVELVQRDEVLLPHGGV